MSAADLEIEAALRIQSQRFPGHPDGKYPVPWYLVVGDPGSGRTAAIKAMNMSWPAGDEHLAVGGGGVLCHYWLPEKALFIEPRAQVVGPSRQEGQLDALCSALKKARPREAIDGIIMVLSATTLVDGTDEDTKRYVGRLRSEVVEVMRALDTELPVYIVVTHYDGLWGFGDAFRWTAARRDEEPWGFSLPPSLSAEETPAQVRQELEGLTARIESICLSKLSSEDPYDERSRAFQHLSEARLLLNQLRTAIEVMTMSNAFESAPWVRALALGSGIPGTGHVLRHNREQLASLSLYAPQHSGTQTPGGMPLHALLDTVLIPERDIVPTRTRWRDDKLLIILMMIGVVAWIGVAIVLAAKGT